MRGTGLRSSVMGRVDREQDRAWGFVKGFSRLRKLQRWYGREEGRTLAVLEAYRHQGAARTGFLQAVEG